MMEEEDFFLLRRRLNNVNLQLELPYWKYDKLSLEFRLTKHVPWKYILGNRYI